MTTTELAADILKRNLDMVMYTLVDFSDADILARPCPGANHTAWQIGHLIVSETELMSVLGKMPELPAGFKDKFSKQTSGNDDPNFFPKKGPLLEQFAKTRNASIAVVKSLSAADLDKPGPKEFQQWVPTVGHMVFLGPSHVAMHIGQIQAIRRKLGKPILF